MKKVMIIGAVDSGKTSLSMALNGLSGVATKTQSLEYQSLTIDTPGEFMENPRMYKALMSTSLEAKYIIFTQDSTVNKSIFPPKFATAFNCMTIGVVTKIDHEDSDVEKAKMFLSDLHLKGPVFEVSAFTGKGLEKLKEFVKQ